MSVRKNRRRLTALGQRLTEIASLEKKLDDLRLLRKRAKSGKARRSLEQVREAIDRAECHLDRIKEEVANINKNMI